MAVPKFRTSSSKRDLRRSHHALKRPTAALCANCGEVRKPHTICEKCGFYKGAQVMDVKNATSWENSQTFE